MLAADIESALQMWSLWVRQGDIGPRVLTTCGSAERHYVAEAGEVFEVEREPAELVVPDHVAMPIERAVCAMADPFRACIVFVYVHRMPPDVLHRRLRRWRSDPQMILWEAKQRVAAALLQRDRRGPATLTYPSRE